MSLEQAFNEACRQIGELSVQNAALQTALAQAEAERDEAGRRITDLLQSADKSGSRPYSDAPVEASAASS